MPFSAKLLALIACFSAAGERPTDPTSTTAKPAKAKPAKAKPAKAKQARAAKARPARRVTPRRVAPTLLQPAAAPLGSQAAVPTPIDKGQLPSEDVAPAKEQDHEDTASPPVEPTDENLLTVAQDVEVLDQEAFDEGNVAKVAARSPSGRHFFAVHGQIDGQPVYRQHFVKEEADESFEELAALLLRRHLVASATHTDSVEARPDQHDNSNDRTATTKSTYTKYLGNETAFQLAKEINDGLRTAQHRFLLLDHETLDSGYVSKVGVMAKDSGEQVVAAYGEIDGVPFCEFHVDFDVVDERFEQYAAYLLKQHLLSETRNRMA